MLYYPLHIKILPEMQRNQVLYKLKRMAILGAEIADIIYKTDISIEDIKKSLKD